MAIGALTLLAALCGLVVERTTALVTLDRLDATSEDHEHRLRVIEQRLGEIHTDVRWIRAAMEGGHAEPWGPAPVLPGPTFSPLPPIPCPPSPAL